MKLQNAHTQGGRLRFTAVAGAEGFANEFTDGGEVGHIRMPYGVYEYGETRCPDGRTRRVVQIWDEASARAVAAALPKEGYPVYQGHPDVPEVAAKYPNKAAVGWVMGIDVANDAATLSVEWIANPGRGFKWFSPYWCGDAEVAPGSDEARVHVSALTSVGLVNNPRIRQFTLANEWGECPADKCANAQPSESKGKENQMDITKLATLLGLPVEGLTEDQIVQEIAKLQKAAVEANDAAKVAADNATAQIAANKAEIDAAKQEAQKAQTAFANERAARIELLLDNALAGGNITPAGKEAWRERLAKDVDAGATALFNERAVKTEPAVTPQKVAERGASHRLIDLANEMMAKDATLDFTAAFVRARREHPELG